MSESLHDQLEELLTKGSGWAKLKVNDLPEAQVLRMPGNEKYKPRLVIELGNFGTNRKFKKLWISSVEELRFYTNIFAHAKLLVPYLQEIEAQSAIGQLEHEDVERAEL